MTALYSWTTSECGELRRFLLLLSITCWTLAGCGSNEANIGIDTGWSELGTYASFSTTNSDVHKASAILVNRDEYKQTFARWQAPRGGEQDESPQLPDGKRAIFVASGSNPVEFTVQSVKARGVTLRVNIDITRYGQECQTAQDIQFPFKVLAVDDASAASAEINATVHTKHC